MSFRGIKAQTGLFSYFKRQKALKLFAHISSNNVLHRTQIICSLTVVEELKRQYNYEDDEIFYDKLHESKISGLTSEEELSKIYLDDSECVVVFLGNEYKSKEWTSEVEWPAIITRTRTRNKKVYILRENDNTELPSGIDKKCIIKTFKDKEISELAKQINDKYVQFCKEGTSDISVITEYPPVSSKIFVGRYTIIEEILGYTQSTSMPVVLLNSMGGIGKTEICKHIFEEYANGSKHKDGIKYLVDKHII